MSGRARDILTLQGSGIEVLAEDSMTAVLGTARTIEQITSEPARRGLSTLVGARAGGGLRAAIDAAVPEDRSLHTPLALLLDDIAGASLVGGFAWSRSRIDWLAPYREALEKGGAPRPQARQMIGVCSGFRPGSMALNPDGTSIGGGHHVAAVPALTDPDDQPGWHHMEPFPDVGLRRARRMDVWWQDGLYHVDAHFRDSCPDPELGEIAVHEYSLSGTVDVNEEVTGLVATARVLPYPECPGAAPNAGRLVGEKLSDLRLRVLDVLTGTDCCTHLNDALRALADVATLLPAVHRADD